MPVTVRFAVNGMARQVEIEPRELLVSVLRDRLGLTGTHIGCETTSCGACTVLAVQAPGQAIMTIEGLARPGWPASGEGTPLARALAGQARS